MIKNNCYFESANYQISRLISTIDRESISKTYGCCDRTFWAWKFTDFPGSRYQEAIYALSWIYKNKTRNNKFYKNYLIKEWIKSGLKYWQKLQHQDGSFDEAYPNEKSLAATSFTSFYLGEAFLLIKDEFDISFISDIKKNFCKAGDWLCKNDETHGILSNHLSAAAAALTIIYKITNQKKYYDRSLFFLKRIFKHQSVEGWYEEYGGADIGYQTHGCFYLARVWQLTKNAELFSSLKLSIKFISNFIHPNLTIGGEYSSRNTNFYFPAAFEILAPHIKQAAAIANFMSSSINMHEKASLNVIDAQNFCPLLNNYLYASSNYASIKNNVELPKDLPGEYYFRHAGIFLKVTKNYYCIFSSSKGGVLKIYDNKTNDIAYSDCGYWIKKNNSFNISSQSFSLTNLVNISKNSITVTAPFIKTNQTTFNPLKFISFRLFNITLGKNKQFAKFIKKILVKTLVSKRKVTDNYLKRKITFFDDHVKVEDFIYLKNKKDESNLVSDAKFSTIHMGSSRYFSIEEIQLKKTNSIKNNKRIYIWKAN